MENVNIPPQASEAKRRIIRHGQSVNCASFVDFVRRENALRYNALPPPCTASMDLPIPNSYWVIPKRLLAGEYPITGYTDARARLARFREAGINFFVDLTEKREMPSYSHLLPVHSKYVNHPITDMGLPSDPEQVVRLLAELDTALQGNRTVYVHCRAGIGRTGTIIGCHLAQESGDGRRALQDLNDLWQQSARSASWPRIPQTQEQADYVERWPNLAKPAHAGAKRQSR